jgi:uncharacterized protein (DUF885 family)
MNMKKILLYTLLVVFLFGAWFSYRLIWGKPLNIDHFFERTLIEMALAEPEILSIVAIVDNTMFDFHSDKLTDASPEHTKKSFERAKNQLAMLERYNRDKLTGQKAISYDMMHWMLSLQVKGEPWLFHDFPVNQMFGVQGTMPSFMDDYHQIVHEKSALRYISRLEAFKQKFEQVTESVQYRAERGVIPPLFVFDHVIKEMNSFISTAPTENSLYLSFERRVDELEDISDERKSELKEIVAERILTHVYPGYQTLIDAFEELKPRATTDAGAWTLPNGDEYYRYMLLQHTTLPLEPDEIHATGLAEVDRIRDEMFSLFDQIGITEGTVSERFKKLDEFPDMFYPETEESYDQVIADYSAMIEQLYEETAPLFNRLPKAPVEVRRVPELTQATAPFAYYSIPAMDGSRPGVFYINLRSLEEIPKYGMMTLSAHEAVPGHHFQLALQQEIENVPTIRNLMPFTAYAEGWALYSEWLVWEAGMYEDDPFGDLGRLQAEMFRAVRLVVDTGIHHQRWTREEAIDYMFDNTGMPMGDIISEIERYIVMPAQATAYKIGMIRMLELRETAINQLGDRFDIREFHDVLLKNGAVPLDVLEQLVHDYIALNSTNYP